MSDYLRSHPGLISPAMRVHWLGWESTTARLQSAGWRISISEMIEINRIQLAIRYGHTKIHGMSEAMPMNYMDRVHGHNYGRIPPDTNPGFGLVLGESIQVQLTPEAIRHFNPVDAVPQIMEQQIMRMEDLALFRKVPTSDNDIIVVPPSMEEILQMALEHQAPKQKELREKARHRMGAIIRVAA